MVSRPMIKREDLKPGSQIILPPFEGIPQQRAVVDVIDHEFFYVTVVKEDRGERLLDDGIREIYWNHLPERLETYD